MIQIQSIITQKLLIYFFINQNEKRYLSELAKILDVDTKNLDTKLKELVKEGLFKSETVGRQKYYSINKEYPLFDEYKKIVDKTIGIEYMLKNSLKKIKGLKNLYIFGSYASNKMNVSSDIDVLAIGSHKILDIQKQILSLQHFLRREINLINFDEKEFNNKIKNQDPFLTNVFKKQIIKVL